MALEPIYEVAAVGGLQKLCSGQVVAEAKLAPARGEEITKILGVSASSDVGTTEVFTGEARVKGKVEFNVLYCDVNGAIKRLSYCAEINDKIENDAITGGNLCVISRILDTDVVSASEEEIRLAAIVEIELYGQIGNRIKYLHKGGENVYSREQKTDYTKILCSFEGNASVSAEAVIDGNAIECVDSRACVNKSIALNDSVVVEGEISSDVIYSAEGGVGHVLINTPFTFEVEASGALSGSDVVAYARITSTKASVVSGEENTALINYDLKVSGFVTQNDTLCIIDDVFSVNNKLVKSSQSVALKVTKQHVYLSDEITSKVTLDVGQPIVDSIVAPLGSSVLLSSAYATPDGVTVEGLIRTSIIYFSGESNSYSAVVAEAPFAITKPMDASENDEVYAVAQVMGVHTKIRRGNELDLRAELRLNVILSANATCNFITELSQGEPIETPTCALSMRVGCKNESLWDVAKALAATPETIERQNPELSFPLSGGERVVLFRRIEK